jgi:hypothetical protein
MTAQDDVLKRFGYSQELDRAVTPFASFCVRLALISATTAVYAGFGFGLSTAGPAFVWTLSVVFVVFAVWALIAADMAVKLPLPGTPTSGRVAWCTPASAGSPATSA